MALTNAERQARWRERHGNRLAVQSACGDTTPQIEKIKKQLARAKEQLEEKEGQRQSQEDRANIAVKQVSAATARALFAEADNERLQADVDDLTEENDRLRDQRYGNDGDDVQDDDIIDDDTPLKLPDERERQRIYDAATEGVRLTVDAFLSLTRKERATAWQLINLYDQLGGRPARAWRAA